MSKLLSPQTTRRLLKGLLVWGPLLGGLVHQLLMNFLGRPAIYIFVPPGYIYPLVSLSWQWWVLLVMASGLISLLSHTSSNRPRHVTNRFVVPFYLYLLFLLLLVKPVGG